MIESAHKRGQSEIIFTYRTQVPRRPCCFEISDIFLEGFGIGGGWRYIRLMFEFHPILLYWTLVNQDWLGTCIHIEQLLVL